MRVSHIHISMYFRLCERATNLHYGRNVPARTGVRPTRKRERGRYKSRAGSPMIFYTVVTRPKTRLRRIVVGVFFFFFLCPYLRRRAKIVHDILGPFNNAVTWSRDGRATKNMRGVLSSRIILDVEISVEFSFFFYEFFFFVYRIILLISGSKGTCGLSSSPFGSFAAYTPLRVDNRAGKSLPDYLRRRFERCACLGCKQKNK